MLLRRGEHLAVEELILTSCGGLGRKNFFLKIGGVILSVMMKHNNTIGNIGEVILYY